MWCWNCSRDREQSKEGRPLYTPGRLARSSKCNKSAPHHVNLQGHEIDKQKKERKRNNNSRPCQSKSAITQVHILMLTFWHLVTHRVTCNPGLSSLLSNIDLTEYLTWSFGSYSGIILHHIA